MKIYKKEDSFRARQVDSSRFKKGNFLIIEITDDIKGKLEGQETTTLQTYIFDKDKFKNIESVKTSGG